MNVGTAKATRVTVSFLLEDLQLGTYTGGPDVPGRTTENGTNERFTWYVGTILPGETKSALNFATSLHSGHDSEVVPNWPGRIGVITATASAAQPEPGILSANNVAKVYAFARRAIQGGQLITCPPIDSRCFCPWTTCGRMQDTT